MSKEDLMEEIDNLEESTEKPVAEKSKRDIVIETIEAGGATMESLIEAADCKYASIMSIFSMLRLMGKCPVKDVETEIDGEAVLTYRFVDAAEWESLKAEKAEKAKAKKAPAKSPEEQLEALKKRVEKTSTAKDAAIERANKDEENELLQLRAEKAAIEFQIAELELSNFEEKMAE